MNFYEQIFSRGRATGEGMTHFERLFAAKFGGSPPPEVREYTGAVPVTITADGTPLLDYIISGNTTQNGTPTPDNPIMPEGCGDITANMLSVYKKNYSINANGVETFNNVAMIYKANVNVSGSTFTLDFGGLVAGDIVRIHAYTGDIWKAQIAAISITQVPFAFTVSSEVDNIRISIRKTATDVTMTDEQYKIPISSANTTTPVYLGEVETTRKIKKLVLTGEENWTRGSGVFIIYTVTDYLHIGELTCICSHYQAQKNVSGVAEVREKRVCFRELTYNQLYIKDLDFTSVDDFKAYLTQQYAAGTPVTIWYVLTTEETAVVNEPLMRIGDYADTLSKAQAGVAIPTNNGSTTVDVDTTVKPSEVYIKYMG